MQRFAHAFTPLADAQGQPLPRALLSLARKGVSSRRAAPLHNPPGALLRGDGGGQSLVKVGEHERCGTYEARPAFCRTHPVAWRAESVEGGPASVSCPVPYGIDPQREADLKIEIQRSIRYWRLHDEIVTEWNGLSCDRGVQDFLRFAVGRGCEAMSWQPGLTLAEGTRDQRLYDAMLEAKVVTQPKFRLAPEAERPFADPSVKPC